MAESSAFAYGLGLMSRETAQLLELMNSEGAIGATQNMLGQAVHAIAQQDTASSILKAVKRRLPRAEAFSCRIDFTGPRIL
jgi:pantoate kinase